MGLSGGLADRLAAAVPWLMRTSGTEVTGYGSRTVKMSFFSCLIPKCLLCQASGRRLPRPRASCADPGMPEDMTTRRPYPSDLSDARWALVEPTLTAWRQRERRAGLRIGRPPRHDLRSLLDAILYVDRAGIPWRYLPHEYPPYQPVLLVLLQAAAERASTTARPPRQILRVLFRPVEPNLMAFTHSISRHLAEST
jgi:hypothetical protein